MKLPGLNFNKSMATSFIYVLCGILIRNVDAGYMVSSNGNFTWFEASNICKEKGLRLEHDFTHFNIEDLRGKQFWIGIIRYEEVSAWIKPLGCFDFNDTTYNRIQADSIRLCQHHCNQSLRFSYQKFTNDCICLDDDDQLKKLEIKDCLVPEKKNSLIVYKRYDFEESMTEDVNKNCLVSTCNNPDITLKAHTCINNGNTVQTLCDNKKPPDNHSFWTYDFTTAQENCNDINKMLIPPNRVECGFCQSKCWTSVYRESVLVEYFDGQSNDGSAMDCLYGDARHSSYPHKFEIKSTSCENQMTFFACKQNLDFDTSGTTSEFKRRNHSGALIGGIVGGIIVIAFAVLLIIFIYRKRNTRTPKKKEVYSDSNSLGSRGNGKKFSNMEYDLGDNIINNTSSSNKAILSVCENKLIPEYSKVDISRRRCTSNKDVYNTAPEGEYDKLNNVLSRKNNNETNLYGITGHGGEDEYDTMKGSLQVKRTEDLYDINIPVYGGKGDSTYDTANSFQHRKIDKNSTYGYSP